MFELMGKIIMTFLYAKYLCMSGNVQSVTFDLLILELKFLFFKNTV